MKTLALVIGIDKYEHLNDLDNAVNDAVGIAERFKQLGYDVIEGYDCTEAKLNDILEDHQRRLPGYDAGIFYFAGHGMEFQGENYLLLPPFETKYTTKKYYQTNGISLGSVFDIYKIVATPMVIIILDACRNKLDGRSIGSGLAAVKAPRGTLVAFSTTSGESCMDDGMDGHSIYTGTLLQHLGREDMTAERLFKNVRQTVANLTGDQQITWEHTSLINEFIFPALAKTNPAPMPYPPEVVSDSVFVPQGIPVDGIIFGLRAHDWDKQNTAIAQLNTLIDKRLIASDLQFLLGRNILQAAVGNSFDAVRFMESLAVKLADYMEKGKENHLLNGMLFEMYFDRNGQFRLGGLKNSFAVQIFQLRKSPLFQKSFEFISKQLEPYKEHLSYIPLHEEAIIADIKVTPFDDRDSQFYSGPVEVIDKITVGGRDVTAKICRILQSGGDESYLKTGIAQHLTIPEELIQIIANQPIKRAMFRSMSDYVKDGEDIWKF